MVVLLWLRAEGRLGGIWEESSAALWVAMAASLPAPLLSASASVARARTVS